MAGYRKDFANTVGDPLLGFAVVRCNSGRDSNRAGECTANDTEDVRRSLAYYRTSVRLQNRPELPALCYANNGERQYRSELNNIAKKYRLKLEYEDKSYGPPHDCSWTSTAYINETPYATGKSRDKGGAREIASKGAVEALESGGYTL